MRKTDYFFGIVVGYNGQIAEDVLVFTNPYRNVSNICNPYLILTCGDEFFYEIRICRETMT